MSFTHAIAAITSLSRNTTTRLLRLMPMMLSFLLVTVVFQLRFKFSHKFSFSYRVGMREISTHTVTLSWQGECQAPNWPTKSRRSWKIQKSSQVLTWVATGPRLWPYDYYLQATTAVPEWKPVLDLADLPGLPAVHCFMVGEMRVQHFLNIMVSSFIFHLN